jgi:dihydroxy-acid dehydratase
MLRSVFEEGTTRWAVRRSQWRSLGITEEQMQLPKIAVVNSSSSLSSCYSHLDDLSRVVQDSIRAAGGLPFEIRTAAPSDFVTSAGRGARYLMPTRDLMVNEIEVIVEGALLDGIVCISSCDKTTPAHLMALARLNLPSIVVIGGYQSGGFCAGMPVDIDDVYESVGAVAAGEMTLSHLRDMTEVAVSSPGVCAGLGTANSMHMIAEALGMTMPGSSPVRATSARMVQLAAAAGARSVALVQENVRARDVITKTALRNAVTMAVAVGASVNTVRHVSAIAAEAEIPIDVVALFEEIADSTPLLTRVRPNGVHRVEDLERAGGCGAVLAQLDGLIDRRSRSVAGGMIGDHLPNVVDIDGTIVHPLHAPASARGGLSVLRGTLAPGGALIKVAAVGPGARQFSGAARVYDSEDAAMEDVRAGTIQHGDVLVLRGMGPKGGPGTVFAAGLVAALVGARLSNKVAVVTDGELSGLNSGMTVGQVMPEAAEGGPLAAVRDGDVISIDLDTRTVDLEVETDIIANRLAEVNAMAQPPSPRGWLGMYKQLVSPIARGAVLVTPPPLIEGQDEREKF